MEEIRTKFGDVDLSYDWKQYFRKEVDRVIGKSIKDLASKTRMDPQTLIDGRVNDLLQLNQEEAIRYIERHGLPRVDSVRMLMAHGDSWQENGDSNFIYHEVNKDGTDAVKKVQDWINQYDGRYGALFIQSCNPAGVRVNTDHSFLVYPTDTNNSQEIMFASMGLGKRILEVKTPRDYSGRRPVTDPQDQILMRFSDLQTFALK